VPIVKTGNSAPDFRQLAHVAVFLHAVEREVYHVVACDRLHPEFDVAGSVVAREVVLGSDGRAHERDEPVYSRLLHRVRDVTAFERLRDERPTGPTGRAEYCDFHSYRMIVQLRTGSAARAASSVGIR
jgi:hypothetical protein